MASASQTTSNPLVVDSREPDKMHVWLTRLGVPAERRQLAVADYRFLDRDDKLVLISRKAGDLLDSVFSGHFADELTRCITLIESHGGGRLIYLQEGLWEASEGDSARLYRGSASSDTAASVPVATQISLQSAGLMFLATNSPWGTAVALASLYSRAQRGWPSKLMMSLPRPELRWNRNEDDEFKKTARLMALWPRLSEQQAVTLLTEHGNIGAIVALAKLEPSPLTITPGVGPKLLDNFRKVVQ